MFSGLAIGLWIRSNTQISLLKKELATLSKNFYELSHFVEKHQDSLTDKAQVKADSAEVTSESVESSPEQVGVVEKISAEKQGESLQPEDAWQEETRESTTGQQKALHKHKPVTYTPTEPEPPLPIDIAISWLKNFFTTGNVLVKVGVLVLFFGVAFLVKYAAERNVFPIELRLAGIGLAGIVLLVIGWRLREKKTGYALVLQGGALGVLYLTVFSALRLYSLLPATLAFSILFVFAAFSAALAVLQNSRALAVLGISGGFLAPILTSTGSGSHIGLFSYYLVLNLGIFGIAWFRSWRLLNVVGFMFTFVVATAWGVKYYTPEFYSSTEPFLITFYLLYVAIAILFAFKQPVELKGYVDSTLVFGVPLVGFGLQAGMVGHIEYALAWSSLALATLYIGLATVLWNRINRESRLICEAFIAIGIMFATLAVPFALDARWTAGTWALEGAAAVWIGSRQSRVLPRLLGYILQFAGGIAFLSSLDYSTYHETFIINGQYIGAVIVALSGLFVAWRADLLKPQNFSSAPVATTRFKSVLQHEHKLSVLFLIWGLIWWYIAGIYEIEDKIRSSFEPLSIIVFMSFSVFATQWFKQKLNWSQLRLPALLLMPVMYLMLPVVIFESRHPFGDWAFFAWAAAFMVFYWVLKQYDNEQSRLLKILHVVGFWLIVLILTVEISWQVDDLIRGADIWWQIMSGLIPLGLMMLMFEYGEKLSWPVQKHRKLYQITAILPIAIGIWIWFVLMNLFNDGYAAPLSYLPLINPLDITLALVLIALTHWLRFPVSIENWGKRKWRFENSEIFLALSIFLWLNTIWLKTAHHLWAIPFEPRYMMHSGLVQAGISILWGVTGLLCMVYGARKLKRHVWIAGVVVMAAVVVKLFMFDLANSGTVERIVSFISVGVLFLVVGYFAPVPPAVNNPDEDGVSVNGDVKSEK